MLMLSREVEVDPQEVLAEPLLAQEHKLTLQSSWAHPRTSSMAYQVSKQAK